MKLSVVIPAAGQGKRMKTEKNKQFLMLNDKEILAHTLNKFESASVVDEVIIVAREEEIDYCKNKLVDNYDFGKVTKVIAGGETRQESVYNGLQAVKSTSNYVLIHDGARPFITAELINKVITAAEKYDAAAVGVPVKDTIKVINSDNMIINTPDRSKLVAIQTPQVFDKELITEAYQNALADDFIGTDSASLVERINQTVKLVQGSYENIKITTPEDLEFGERILARRK
ncbi:2-C-methyl-D-erythritol 4-phosphate cytidylyltransferase [Halanaerobacter jeridensis]|uniref:2-C-methyl-D-erythritol 4-phosphate cytidylyltransferase n=1 Tax=Halanaerobacter jeridensis TaxID=706427 RepID=A0A939BS03_9FIRM|nr:2-C-methyl-D-erythritol 4-phosphate cytidylyltransferase [Halanaerobacter jeridensis]MBM7557859.1 2-C-methyl-D-erythritol 4-phosphate cytidylyltransferase [Halanaerobacter jeridensis]